MRNQEPRIYAALKDGFTMEIGGTTYQSGGLIDFAGTRAELNALFGEENIKKFIVPSNFQDPSIQWYEHGWLMLGRETYQEAMKQKNLTNKRSNTMSTAEKKANEISIKKPENALTRAETEVGNIISQIESQIADKEDNYEGMVYDATNKEGYETCREVCKELRPLRADIEKTRKALKAPITSLGKTVDTGFKGMLARMDKLIEPAQTAYRKEDERKEREEKERIEKAESAMNWMRDLCNNAMQPAFTSERIKNLIEQLEEKELDPELFQELLADATNLKEQTLQGLNMAFNLKQQAEESQRQLAEMQQKATQSEPQQESESQASNQQENTKEPVREAQKHDTTADAASYMVMPGKKEQPAKLQSYEPLQTWPSDADRADDELLDSICTKLEEAEEYIEFLEKQVGISTQVSTERESA